MIRVPPLRSMPVALLVALLSGLWSARVAAEAPFEPGEVRATAKADPSVAGPGDLVTLEITVRIAPGWHIYAPDEENEAAIPTTFAPAKGLEAIGGLEPDRDPVSHEMVGVGEITFFEGEVVFTQDLLVSTEAASRELQVLGELQYLPCTMEMCLPPDAIAVSGALKVDAAAGDEESVAPAEEGAAPQPAAAWKDGEVRVAARVTPEEAAPGSLVTLEITTTIAPGWHIYAPDETNEACVPTRFVPVEGLLLEGDLTADRKPISHDMLGVGVITFFEEEVVFRQELRVADSATPGALTMLGELAYLPCTIEYCLQPATTEVAAPLEILPGDGSAGAGKKPTSGRTEEGRLIEKSIHEGLLPFMGVCALFALLALLTPCVYPMIPITVSYFTKASHASRSEAVSHALAYAFGIVATYVGFGVAVRALLGDMGPTWIATNGYVNSVVAAVFVVFGLSLMGMFDLELPSSWVEGMKRVAGKSTGYLGDLLMGFTFTLAAFTCTVPIVAIILRLGVEVGNFHMFLGMLTYATVFAAPFFLLALVPQWVKSMPRAGGWLNSVKVVLAFIEFAAAFKFLAAADFYFTGDPGTIFTYTVVVFSWSVLMLLCGCYLLGFFRFEHDAPMEHVTAPRVLVASVFLVFGIYLVAGGFGRPLAPWIASLAPPEPDRPVLQGTSAAADLPPWEVAPKQNGPEQWAQARAVASAEGKPIFVDFTGFT